MRGRAIFTMLPPYSCTRALWVLVTSPSFAAECLRSVDFDVIVLADVVDLRDFLEDITTLVVC